MRTPEAVYKEFTDTDLQKVLLVEYRCARGCLLLHVFASPTGPMYYRPAMRISKSMQSRTGIADVGRVPERAGRLDELSDQRFVWGDDENSILMGCSHCIGVHFPAETVKAHAVDATPGTPFKDHSFWMTPNPPK